MAKLVKIAILLFLITTVTIMGINYITSPYDANNKEKTTITFPQNTSVIKIGDMLQQANIIKNKYLFKYYVRYKAAGLKAGTYNLSPSMTIPQIIELLEKGEQTRIMFTIPEGYTVKQIAKLLADNGLANYDVFMGITENKQFNYPFLDYKLAVNNPLEGFLFPDTYYIPKNFSEEAIIDMMLKRFDEVFDETMRTQMQEQDISYQQAVTMASLVEKEAKVAAERPIIAGVFYNRLKINMRLESCATIQYLLGKAKPVLLYEDLKIESPYNTYRNSGLPPGPIANPGKASLKAALYPDNTKYFYFVAKPDGSHYFSKTLSEHNKAKRKYLP